MIKYIVKIKKINNIKFRGVLERKYIINHTNLTNLDFLKK